MLPLRWSLFVALLCVASVQAQDVDAERKALSGTWMPTAAELGGKPLPEDMLKAMKLVLAGEKYTVTVGPAVDRGTFKLDPAKKPRAMDIVGVDGPNEGKTFLAIYELQGNTLRVCYDLSGKTRPGEFKTSREALYLLITYQRAK